jgi:beta-glucosidase
MSGFTRREILAASAAVFVGGDGTTAHAIARSARAFPTGFLWGAATAGHQVEGNNTNSDIWAVEHVKPSIFTESSGDACDSFNRWPEDMDIVRNLGLNSYRFSLEWARIEPSEGEFSLAMLDHYQRMIEGCRARGLVPVVTFNHFTTPRWFAARGGWESTGAADYFARYCELAAKGLAAQIGYATTLNEPNLTRILRWLPLPFPPEMMQTQEKMLNAAAQASGSDKFSVAIAGDPAKLMPQLIAGHNAGVAAIKGVRPDLPVGVSLSITDDQAIGPNSKRDAKREDVYGAWLEAARASDFIGVQNYGRQRLDDKGPLPPPRGAELTQMGEEFYPASLEGAVRYAHAATGRPVLITENGIAATDDTRRAAYIPLAVAGVQRAIADGVPIIGYIHWSLLDNFEWLFGYTPKYGLVEVDRTTFKRTLKPSARVLGEIARRNGI